MNVLLVYPRYPETFWSFSNVLSFISKKAAFPPLGLLTIAAMLPEAWNRRLVDANVAPLRDEDLAWADLVMISAMLIQVEPAREIVARAKALGKTVVAGGPAFNAQPELFPEVDHLVLNEAEVTLPLFLAEFGRGVAERIYASKERPDIALTPVPDWSLIDMKQYATMSVQYSRGCPFNCEFCDIVIMNGRTPRTKSPEQMLTELQALYDAGWRSTVFVVDDNFIGNTVRVKGMLRALVDWQKARGYPFTFLTEASTNLADDQELMGLMSAANFSKVFLGIETPSVESLKECGKHQNATRNLAEAVRTIQSQGLQVMGGFIVGFDHDTERIFESQIGFIQKVGVVTAMVGLLNAIPGTRLWHRLKAEGRLLGEATGENTDGTINFVPRMDRETLLAGYRKILATIYSPKHYYRRVSTFIANYNPTVRRRLTFEELRAFAKSTVRIGLVSRASLQYWKLLIKTALTKRQALPTAVELAIYWLHFNKVARRVMQRG